MNDVQYISPYKITKKYDVTSGTLVRWADEGKIKYIRTTGKRLYNVNDINKIFGIDESSRKKVCYARVSTNHQKEDLDRQIKVLREKYPDSEIITDIGSGLNWKRKGFNSLLERINDGEIEELVVTYKDRLCRFGFELMEWILKKANTNLVVLNHMSEEKDATAELSEDVLSIINYFVASNNGSRAARFRRERKEKENKEKQQKIELGTENKN